MKLVHRNRGSAVAVVVAGRVVAGIGSAIVAVGAAAPGAIAGNVSCPAGRRGGHHTVAALFFAYWPGSKGERVVGEPDAKRPAQSRKYRSSRMRGPPGFRVSDQ